MTTCIIAEKPSVARDIARIVGATHSQDGFIEGKGYLVTWAFGHLITLALPEHYGLRTYKADELPIPPQPFQLIVRQIRKEKSFEDDPTALKQLKVIRSCFERAEQIIILPMQEEKESSSSATSTPTSPAESPSNGYGSPPSPTRRFRRGSPSSNPGSGMTRSTRQAKLVAKPTGKSASKPAEHSR